MAGKRCCECHKKATVFRAGAVYCDDCKPKSPVEEKCVCSEEPASKKESFWSKIGKLFINQRYGG